MKTYERGSNLTASKVATETKSAIKVECDLNCVNWPRTNKNENYLSKKKAEDNPKGSTEKKTRKLAYPMNHPRKNLRKPKYQYGENWI